MRKSLCVIMALVLALCLSPVAMAEDYTATAKGFGGDVTVTLTIEDGKLTAVKAEGPDETEGIGSKRNCPRPWLPATAWKWIPWPALR